MRQSPKIKKLPDAVFWDWDGTIADSYGFLNDAHNHTLRSLGFEEFKDGEYKEYFGKPREILYPAIYKDKCDQAMEVFQSYVFENSHKVKVIDGTGGVLDHLHSQNIVMGVVTNKKSSFVSRELQHTAYKKYFSVLVGSGEAKKDKPSPAPLRLALDKAGIGVQTHNIWYIGDTENDLACARAAGCDSLFLKGDNNTDALINEYKPIFSFDNYQELKEFLTSI